MFRTVAILRREQWAPDILSCDLDSMYNLLHEHIALVTFEQVSSAFGYSHMGLDLSLLHDFPLMQKLYWSFILNNMYDITKVEVKKPGSIAKGKLVTNVCKHHDEVSDDHLTFAFFVYTVQQLVKARSDLAQAEAFHWVVLDSICENEAHSDDELFEEAQDDASKAVI